jgi:GNAT superfamily N-acetyltransferase
MNFVDGGTMLKVTNSSIRRFEPEDAEAVSSVVRHTMKISNSGDYSLERLQPLIDYFSPEKMLQLSRERDCLVAVVNNEIVGTVALEGCELCTFFVHPDYQRMGIGAQLLQAIEQIAIENGIKKIHTDASITGEAFYRKMGYRRTGMEKEGTAGKQIGIEKEL